MYEQLLERAVKMLIDRMPQTSIDQVAKVAQAGIELKSQLDRIEAQQAAIGISLRILVKYITSGKLSANDEDFSHELVERAAFRDYEIPLQLGSQSRNAGNAGTETASGRSAARATGL